MKLYTKSLLKAILDIKGLIEAFRALRDPMYILSSYYLVGKIFFF